MGGVIGLWLQWLYELAHRPAYWAMDGALDVVIASSWWLS
jgi:hypothetical protein